MIRLRKNVHMLGGDWADEILWYARGVKALKARSLADPTSWLFYAGIHGAYGDLSRFVPGLTNLWEYYGIIEPSTQRPGAADTALYWNQCQHQSWYFLPWHRGYLLGIERLLRDCILALGGPEDWALPYWNYFGTGQQGLPPAFAGPDWSDGQGDNPLFVPQRWGPLPGGGAVFVPLSDVSLDAMDDAQFTGIATGGTPGFGGPQTGFWPGGGNSGGVESQPHNNVHVLVGGSEPTTGIPGLMSYPPTAALDPVFYLHHANIDRLWSSWRRDPDHHDPGQSIWLEGPGQAGQRSFAMPNPDGTRWDFAPKDMRDTHALGYEYDDLTPGAPDAPVAPGATARLVRLGAPDSPVTRQTEGDEAMTPPQDLQEPELIGSNDSSIRLRDGVLHAPVRLDPAGRERVSASLSGVARGAAPDRVFLNLENVRGLSDAIALRVYVGMESGANPSDHPENLAGTVSLFGVSRASDPDDSHAGSGLTLTVEITDVVDRLHLGNAFDVKDLSVHLVPITEVPEAAATEIGRISVYRQGAMSRR